MARNRRRESNSIVFLLQFFSQIGYSSFRLLFFLVGEGWSIIFPGVKWSARTRGHFDLQWVMTLTRVLVMRFCRLGWLGFSGTRKWSSAIINVISFACWTSQGVIPDPHMGFWIQWQTGRTITIGKTRHGFSDLRFDHVNVLLKSNISHRAYWDASTSWK